MVKLIAKSDLFLTDVLCHERQKHSENLPVVTKNQAQGLKRPYSYSAGAAISLISMSKLLK